MASVDTEPTRRFTLRGREPGEIRVGDVIASKYEVTRAIGKGGMGVVVEAKHLGHAQRVALKILHERHAENREAVGRFTQEARAYASVRGEHSVRILDVGEHDRRPFLVMELLLGSDLERVMDEGPMPLETAALYILQACEGISEVHANGMVHRDLKPSNLFVASRPDGSPLLKILDFGIVKGVLADDPSIAVQTQTMVAMGTPLYMAPEQIRSSRTVDARADVWSLGAILYELVAGRPAFGGNTLTHITAQVLEADPPALSSLVPGVPAELDAIVARALAKRPDDRFVDAAALANALAPLGGAEGAHIAARCSRILQGALRPDTATSPPVAHDDPRHGTLRFDRGRRARLAKLGVGLLAVVCVVLVTLAVAAYGRARGAESRVLAQRGVRSVVERSDASPAAARPRPSLPAQAAEVRSGLAATASASAPLPASGPSASGATVPRPRPFPPTATPAPTAPPNTTAKPAATVAPFNPFSDRN